MRKVIAIMLAFILALNIYTPTYAESGASAQTNDQQSPADAAGEELIVSSFYGLNDPKLLQYVEDSVYSELEADFASEDYIIETVQAAYVSKEYLEELAYNSQANIFFGYTLAELDAQFQGTRYVFTLGDNGETVVKPFEGYDTTFETALKNIAIGTGVILICVTVSVVAGAAGFVPVSLVFAASAKTATTFALSSAMIGGVSAGVVEGFQTKDFDNAVKAAALGGSEGFKWGAISGAVIGGATKLSDIQRTLKAVEGGAEYFQGAVDIPADADPFRQAELRALNEYGGFEQLTYLNGEQVLYGTQGATRPDVIRFLGDHIEAVEVKYYNLESPHCTERLLNELERQVSARLTHLPKGSTQRIILDVTGRSFSEATVEAVKDSIWQRLNPIYQDIPIEIVGLT